ncbi:sensor histidine kinase [Aliiroseovarius sp. F20344]|uniref:sensor histidine kinase n=1 Tax=Aliiroseovarius sp. F20344 TaxID=2926414 RepID=UPI001FF68F4E|nr:sensor histidine kinase [Aliiroseovarius sp. F20344]MCK0143000.1 ATP-binding protein [Aliiroseovarius sp. F20344]
MTERRPCLVLTQHRENRSEYNDFIGKFYHFPATSKKSYASQFNELPLEFVYYEPQADGGKGEFFGYGVIEKEPFEDKQNPEHFFVEIASFKPFGSPVPHKDEDGKLREADNPHYNYQNAVRKIPSKLLDEICLDGNVQLNFTSDAHLIRVLGEQLIASEKVGILELIKNAYDAHATHCKVTIENSDFLPQDTSPDYQFGGYEGPVIVIEDDGIGMDRNTIEKGWLRPASTLKTNIKERLKLERAKAAERGALPQFEGIVAEIKRANKGRIPLGEKGVGRFATHRLGRFLELTTKTANNDYEFVLSIDWDQFDRYSDRGVDLSEIGVGLSRRPESRDYGDSGSGTRIVIFGGRDGFRWDQEKVSDLSRSINQLRSPNPNPKAAQSAFEAKLLVPQVPDLEDQAPSDPTPVFEFVGLVDDFGKLDYTLTFKPPKSVPMPESEISEVYDLKAANKGFWRGREGERTECGAFFLSLNVWYRVSPWITGPDKDAFTKRLDRFGGISIYRDGINVFPAEWGADVDWLRLSKEHIKKGKLLSYYNLFGNVEIDQATNLALTDKTNREGMIENEANADFVELIRSVLKTVVENQFIAKRDEYTSLTKDVVRTPSALRDYAKQSLTVHKSIDTNYPVDEDPFAILETIGKTPEERVDGHRNLTRSLRNLQQSLDLITEQQEMLTEQAGYGLAIGASIHEINKITTSFFYGINEVLKKKTPDREKLEQLKDTSSSLRNELKRLSPVMALRGEKRREFPVINAVGLAIDNYRSRLAKRDITIDFDQTKSFDVYTRYGAVVQVFSNLLDNACYWLESEDIRRRRISIQVDEENRSILFADDGPGIHEAILPHLFLAGYSMKVPRSGLGLYISKHYMQDMKGDILCLESPKLRDGEFHGAQFMLDFNKVPKRKVI